MKKINSLDSIIRPIITEKATILSEQNKTVFKVHNSANKKNIKKNIEKIFKVNVIKINISWDCAQSGPSTQDPPSSWQKAPDHA